MNPNMSKEERKEFVAKMLEVVGDKNRTDLIKAIDIMQEKAYELSDINAAAAIVGGAVIGAAAGYVGGGGPWGAAAGGIIGGLSGLITVGEVPKWNNIDQFLTQLLKGFIPELNQECI
jgi:F0F1-type ATP synthase assembly protein I